MGAQLTMFEPTTSTSTSSLVGATIKLKRGDHCCDDICIIASSKGLQHASLNCAGCGRHRGWLPARAITFISNARDLFGISAEPLLLRTPISTSSDTETSMAKDARSKPNTGALFKNPKKTEGDNRPDYTGPVDVGGREYWLSGWIKESQAGAKYMSIAIKPKDGDENKAAPADDAFGLG